MAANYNHLIEVKRLEGREELLFRPTDTELVFVCKGNMVFRYADGETETLHERTFVLLQPDSGVRLHCTDDTLLVICRPTPVGQSLEFIPQDRKPLIFNEVISNFIDGLVAVIKDGLHEHAYIEGKIRELILLLQFYYKDKFTSVLTPRFYADVCFIEKVSRNTESCKTVAELAQLCHMSESGFYKKFENLFGQTPQNFLMEIKRKKIYEALADGYESISLLSDSFGFATVSNFGRFCKTHFGRTPREIRRNAPILEPEP